MLSLSYLVLSVLATASLAQHAAQSEVRPIVADWNFRYNIFGDPVAVILKDNDMSGLASPLRARLRALIGPLAQAQNFTQADKALIDFMQSGLYKELDRPLPNLKGTKAWAEIMQYNHDNPGSANFFVPMYHSSLFSLGFFWTSFNEIFTFHPQQAAINCPCGLGLTCSPRSVGAMGGPPYTSRDLLKAMLDTIVAMLQDEPMMQRLEKWTFNNPWLRQDQKLMRVAGLPSSAASDLRGILVIGQYSVYQLLHRFNSDCPVANVECGSKAINTCTRWVE